MDGRFQRLAVGTQMLTDVPTPDFDLELLQNLISFYRSFSFYEEYGAKSIDYICGLSIRYAHWTSGTLQKQALESYSLWLSLVWIIDGVSDKLKEVDSGSLIRIIKEEEITTSDPFILMVQSTYKKYLSSICLYRKIHPEACNQISEWTINYLRNLGNNSPSDYQEWRLIDGAMMCVVWHLILFTGSFEVSPQETKFLEISPQETKFFERVSLLVSYHNDLLSLPRDISQGTPNLVTARFLSGEDYWSAVQKTIEYIDHLYQEIAQDLPKEDLGRIGLSILEGSHNWANSEERYKVGREMLEAYQRGDREEFNRILKLKNQTAGDPL